MANNDYYYNDPSQSQGQAPYYQHHNPQPPPLTSLPSYHSQAPQRSNKPLSPFNTPFDDNAYPIGNMNAHGMDSQTTLGPDSRYYEQGGGGRPQDSQTSLRDDIPLRDYPAVPPKDDRPTDHVYDAPPPNMIGEERRQQRGRNGFFKTPLRKIPWVVYTLTFIQIVVFIAEIAKNGVLTGSPIEIHPSFNPMIGPSPWVLINMGARYVPCMHNVAGIQDSVIEISWGCPNTTDLNIQVCTLGELCGFSGFQNPFPNPVANSPLGLNQKPEPNQWFRFIIPMFLHAGIIHIGFNMLLQLTMAREMEVAIGPIRFFLVYISSGIFGFVLGGNFAASGIASTGASGSLFGIIALTLLDLLYTWRERPNPWRDFAFIALDVVISFVLGLLPGLDNFSHIGGFLMGLVLGICILHSPNALRKRISKDEPPYEPVSRSQGNQETGVAGFAKHPLAFFQGRKPAWWAWWLVRAASLVAVFVVFILLLNNFYIYRKTCSWCKYLSCLNVNNWCDIGNIQLTTTNTTSKRSILDSWDAMAQLYQG